MMKEGRHEEKMFAAPASPVSEEGSMSAMTGGEKPGLELLCQAAVVSNDKKEAAGEAEEDEEGSKGRGKKPWTREEDELLRAMVERYGPNRWTVIANKIPARTGKQARERWLNQLSPDVKRKGWTPEEDRIIVEAHAQYGNKWSMIAKLLHGRTDNSIKNRFNSTLRRRLQRHSSAVHYSRQMSPVGFYRMPPVESPQPLPHYFSPVHHHHHHQHRMMPQHFAPQPYPMHAPHYFQSQAPRPYYEMSSYVHQPHAYGHMHAQ
mmetsp:Transcript_11805/g.36013  ORF Transcript_11805/g.36013 Transcript_11805/m.36013 type:complete len:262 (+) Transcript_11805:70-855(+)